MRCRRCDSQVFTAVRSVGVYERALRESVLALKQKPHLSSLVVEALVGAANRQPLSDATRIVPVPLHDKRIKERGFNQAAVIAEALATHLQLPSDEVSLARIHGSDKYRAGLDPKGRRDTVTGAFMVRYPLLIENENVLLVDDVFTTGATVDACAEVLLKAGARQVFVLTVARGKS